MKKAFKNLITSFALVVMSVGMLLAPTITSATTVTVDMLTDFQVVNDFTNGDGGVSHTMLNPSAAASFVGSRTLFIDRLSGGNPAPASSSIFGGRYTFSSPSGVKANGHLSYVTDEAVTLTSIFGSLDADLAGGLVVVNVNGSPVLSQLLSSVPTNFNATFAPTLFAAGSMFDLFIFGVANLDLDAFGFTVDIPNQKIPEPGTLALFGLGLVGMTAFRKSKSNRKDSEKSFSGNMSMA